MQPIKVLFVSPSFYPATYYGGPTFVNRALCDALSKDQSVQLRVLTTDADGPQARVSVAESEQCVYPITYCRRVMPPDIAPGLWWRLFGMVKRADVVHLNAVYSFTTIPTLAVCRLLRKPVVWSLHGALQRWPGRRRKPLKRAWISLANLLCEPERTVVHNATPEEETESLPALSRVRSTVIPYGVEVPDLPASRPQPGAGLSLLYLGRLHPIKGIENLVRALKLVETPVTLEICGAGEESFAARLRKHVSELDLGDRVRFHARIPDELKASFFARADLCMVPSFKESFGSVVAEALAHGVPVIASQGTPWRRMEELGCGLWVENTPEAIAAAIDRAAQMPRLEMGQRGRAWMEREFKWSQVAAGMLVQYRVLAHREAREETSMAGCSEAASTARHA